MLTQRLDVFHRAIALVAVKAIHRVVRMPLLAQTVAVHLGQHGRGRHGSAGEIGLHAGHHTGGGIGKRVGLGLLVIWVGALQILLDKGNELDWFGSPFIVTLGTLSIWTALTLILFKVLTVKVHQRAPGTLHR